MSGQTSSSGRWAWLFPVVLFAFATLYFGGRAGWWTDDYWLNQRHPVTGAIEALTIDRGFFLRPLFYIVAPAVITLFWESQWPAHLIQILLHGAVVLAAFRLMVFLGATRRAAGAAAMLFMVYPASFETLFWVAALPTTLACLLMMGVLLLMVRFAWGQVGWWAAAVMAATVGAMCCLNEQPAAGIAAMPLVYWAALASPRGRDAPPRIGKDHLARAMIPTVCCGVAALVYATLVLTDRNKPANARSTTLVTLDQLDTRTVSFLDVLWRRLVLKNFGAGAFRTGWEAVTAAGWMSALWGAALLVTAVLWARWWIASPEAPPRTPVRRMLALGAVFFITGWLPILVFAAYEPDSRTRYWPCIGAAIMVAGAGTALARRAAAWKPAVRAIWAAALIAVLIPSAVMLIGTQVAFRNRHAKDLGTGEQLRRLVPDPIPLTFFQPMTVQETAVRTGSPVFDLHFRSAWEFPWTSPKFIMSVYRRTDVRCGYYRHWTPGRPVIGADETGVHYADRLGPAFPPIEGSGSRVSWERLVPFIIDRDGVVRLVTRVNYPGPDGTPRQVRIPQVPPGTPDLEWTLPRG